MITVQRLRVDWDHYTSPLWELVDGEWASTETVEVSSSLEARLRTWAEEQDAAYNGEESSAELAAKQYEWERRRLALVEALQAELEDRAIVESDRLGSP